MMGSLTSLLLQVSSALLIPVVLLLLLLGCATLGHLGGMVGEAVGRARHAGRFRRVVASLKHGHAESVKLDSTEVPRLVSIGLSQGGAHRDKVVDDLQLLAERLLSRLMLGVRLGPMLGLAGTLIPLGPALVALSKGDYDTLSQRLVVAFSTTVLGLVVGGLCFAMHLVKKHWYMQDLSDVEFLLGRGEVS